MKLGSAILALLDGLLVKGAVMALCAWLIFRVARVLRPGAAPEGWAARSAEERGELRILFASLLVFGLSELVCAIEMYAFVVPSAGLDGLHSISSAIGMGLFGLWLFAFADRKLLRFAQPACLVNRVCAGCTVPTPAGCKMRNLLSLFAAFLAFAAVPALLVPTASIPVDAARYALPFPSLNAWYDSVLVPWVRSRMTGQDPTSIEYFVPSSTLWLELRLVPAAAFVASAAALGLTRFRREVAGLKVMGFAAGMLGYTWLELAVFAATREPVLGSLLHELAELWFLLATAELLRRGFGREAPPAGQTARSSKVRESPGAGQSD